MKYRIKEILNEDNGHYWIIQTKGSFLGIPVWFTELRQRDWGGTTEKFYYYERCLEHLDVLKFEANRPPKPKNYTKIVKEGSLSED